MLLPYNVIGNKNESLTIYYSSQLVGSYDYYYYYCPYVLNVHTYVVHGPSCVRRRELTERATVVGCEELRET